MLHVPHLRLQLVALGFVGLAALEDFEGFLFEGGFPRAVAHAAEFGLVGGEFGIEGREFDVDGGNAVVDAGDGRVEGWFGAFGSGAEEAVHGGLLIVLVCWVRG